MWLEEKGYDLRKNTKKFTRCAEKNLQQARCTEKEKKIVTLATKNMVATSKRETLSKNEKKFKTNLKMKQPESGNEKFLPKQLKEILKFPLTFRGNWRTTARNHEGPTTNGRKAQSRKHLCQQIYSNKNWHKEDFSEKLKINRKKTCKKGR